ncbi:DDE-type integrase/transposase/recombinase (plasmid) [Piscirickettsia salmonis]|nr:DDE-type integrase/transposase/recombinase [Piscirickettsia salmonis]
MECADSRHATLCDADSRGFIVVAFCSAILHHWMCKIPTEVATLTRVKYLNNCIENDHKAVKRKSRFRQWYQSLSTARPTIDIMEAMRMVQKGQLRYIKKQNICAQNQLIDKLFGLAA